jgi:hypothetical protein
MKTKILLLLTVALLAGCHSYDYNGHRSVRYAGDVRVLVYDQTPRQPAANIQIFDNLNPPPAKYKVIARLGRDGNRSDETRILGALAWRARQLGANGMIVGVVEKSDQMQFDRIGNYMHFGPGSPRFNGVAILYQHQPEPTTSSAPH